MQKTRVPDAIRAIAGNVALLKIIVHLTNFNWEVYLFIYFFQELMLYSDQYENFFRFK